MTKPVLSGLFPEEIATALQLKKYQGTQLFEWIQQKRVLDVSAMTNLSKGLRTQLPDMCHITRLKPVEVRISSTTGTKKALFRLHDGETVESVLIRDRDRITICVSSQVGCALQCAFCATGQAGFTRNLSTDEIAEQILFLLQGETLAERTPNIVYMGMGEPLRNYDAVMRSIRLLMHARGLHIGARKITLSTVGDVKRLQQFILEDWQVRLSVSLHAANDTLRDRLAPVNRRYPLAVLKKALQEYIDKTGRQITLEWTLLNKVNDGAKDVKELFHFLAGLRASVNLIPWNPVAGLPYTPSPSSQCTWFMQQLQEAGITATLRQEKGQDIEAACGQLRRIHGEKPA